MSDHAHLAGPAEAFARERFDIRHASRHARHEREFPAAAAATIAAGGIDLLLNYLAPMIVPGHVLRGVRREAINFHPAPPRWPGVGSASYALYHGDATFGATAHRMITKIDAGRIVRVIRFPILPDDSCDTLFERGLAATLTLFYDVCDELTKAERLTPTGDEWEREAITRAEFDRWMRLSPSDPPDEIARKVRALRHPQFPGPFFDVDGVLSEVSHHWDATGAKND